MYYVLAIVTDQKGITHEITLSMTSYPDVAERDAENYHKELNVPCLIRWAAGHGEEPGSINILQRINQLLNGGN